MTTTVIIPVYNEEKTISACLDALLQQTQKADEIIVVDNNSTDASVAIAQKYTNVIVIQEKNQGVSHARRTGFHAASGELLLFTDADSIADKNWVKNITAAFTDDGVVAVSGKVHIILPENNEHPINESRYWKIIHPLMIKINRPLLWGANMAFRKNVLRNEYFPIHLQSGSDFVLGRKVARHKKTGQKILYAKNAIVTAHDTPSLVPKRNMLDHFLAELGIFRKKLHATPPTPNQKSKPE